MSLIVAILSDTHVPYRAATVPVAVMSRLAEADVILHAGDVCTAALLDELAAWGPVHAVLGNCDPPEVRRWGARDELILQLEGVGLAMTHDAGPKEGRARRMRRRFPDADVVVFGHSHMPLAEWGEGLLLLNPGSPTDRRRAPSHTMAILRIDGGSANPQIVEID